ncbi:MAG: 4-(cytidine 5'-diphospho)-2-C-methyl-D-erythritol kinase [Hyphomicrobiales bacterium]
MTGITEFARAKINLALHVLGRRQDGYHEIDSIVAFADVADELQFAPASEFVISASGPFAGLLLTPENNIILAAYKAVTEIAAVHGKHLPPVSVGLTKNLPVAAGIGGGSADAAAAMRGFLRLAGIAAIDAEIAKAALSLGADVPVCLGGRACRMQGVGERITPLENFEARPAVLIYPGIEVRTAAVFRKLGLARGASHGLPLADLTDAANWRNDLMPPAVTLAPAIADVIAALENQKGLRFARMSGSGATCFGVFETADAAFYAAQVVSASYPRWWVRHVALS